MKSCDRRGRRRVGPCLDGRVGNPDATSSDRQYCVQQTRATCASSQRFEPESLHLQGSCLVDLHNPAVCAMDPWLLSPELNPLPFQFSTPTSQLHTRTPVRSASPVRGKDQARPSHLSRCPPSILEGSPCSPPLVPLCPRPGPAWSPGRSAPRQRSPC